MYKIFFWRFDVNFELKDDGMTEEEKDWSHMMVKAMDDLTIAARLRFVFNLLSDNGGDRATLPQNPVLVVAAEVLRDVTKVIESRPRIASLRRPANE